jgi:CheY-like chemotaxis protein
MTASRAPGLKDRRVLVVEDEYFLADDLARALHDAGAQVVGPIATAAESLALLRSGEQVDLAVLDINLRGEMAYSVLDLLRDRGTPTIVATGYDRGSILPAYRDLPRFEKPFFVEDLLEMLPGLLKSKPAA